MAALAASYLTDQNAAHGQLNKIARALCGRLERRGAEVIFAEERVHIRLGARARAHAGLEGITEREDIIQARVDHFDPRVLKSERLESLRVGDAALRSAGNHA